MSRPDRPSPYAGSLTSRALWLMSAKTMAFVFGFVLPLLLVRRLSQTEFGLYKQVFLIVNSAITVLPFGFAMSAYYFLPRERDRQAQVVFNILVFNTVIGGLACLALVLRPELLARLFQSPALMPHAPLIGLVVLLWTVSAFLETVAVAHQETALATVFIIVAQLSKTSLLMGAAIVAGSVEALIQAAAAQGAIQTVILLAYLRSRFGRFWRGFEWSMLRTQLAYAVPLGFAGMLWSLQNDLHNYFVSNHFGAAAFAIYSIGCFQLPLVGILRESVTSVMIPRVSELQKQGAAREIVLLTARVMRKLAAVFFPLYALLLVTGRELLTFLFTPAYLPSWPVFAVYVTLIPAAVVVVDPIMRAYAEQRFFLLRVKMGVFAAMFLSLWFGTGWLGLTGVIAVVVATNLAEVALFSVRMARVLGVGRRDIVLLRDVGKLALAAAVAGGAAVVTRWLVLPHGPLAVLLATGTVVGVTYVTAVLALGVLTPDERRGLWRRLAPRRRVARGPDVPTRDPSRA